MKEYITYKENVFKNEPLPPVEFCKKNSLEGTEVFFDDMHPRTLKLFTNDVEKTTVLNALKDLNVKRLHCSYWAYPASFLTKNNFTELLERFGSIEAVKEYYGDLTGDHLWDRWSQEYEIAASLGAQAYTLHLIDYAPIDGAWEFTIPVSEIKQAMIYMIQQFLVNLEARNLLNAGSPQIEIENAGWGLEYGTQSETDFVTLFSKLYDPHNKVKIGWDINHLLHAVGMSLDKQRAVFMLPGDEKNPDMVELEKNFGGNPGLFAYKWVESNILSSGLLNKAGSLHLSDCGLKDVEYFVRGKLRSPYFDEMKTLRSWEEKEKYGVKIVLGQYDSHIPIQTGILNGTDIKNMIDTLKKHSPGVVLLHELKNSESIQADLDAQKKALYGRAK